MVRSRMHGLSSRADRGASEKLEFLIYFLDPVTLGRESSCWRPELQSLTPMRASASKVPFLYQSTVFLFIFKHV